MGFTVREISGKGIGMIADKHFKVGDVILREKPLINMPNRVFENPDLDYIERWLDRQINKMSSDDRVLFYDLSDCRSENGEKSTLGIFFTNCMTFQGDDTALFPTMARVNHSCNPKSEFVTRQPDGCQELIAVKPVSIGEEITLSYLGSSEEGSGTRKTRSDYLRRLYLFRCVCEACAVPDSSEDDKLRSKIQELQVKGTKNLNLYELERLVDGLEKIESKMVYMTEINEEMLDKAMMENDKLRAIKSMSSIYMLKNITGAEDAENWMDILKNANPVMIGGRCYMFPPSDV